MRVNPSEKATPTPMLAAEFRQEAKLLLDKTAPLSHNRWSQNQQFPANDNRAFRESFRQACKSLDFFPARGPREVGTGYRSRCWCEIKRPRPSREVERWFYGDGW